MAFCCETRCHCFYITLMNFTMRTEKKEKKVTKKRKC